MSLSLQEAFSSLEDPRIERHKRHQLLDIIVLTICAVVSGAEGREAIEAFGKEKQDWLRQWIALENGIPSHDCIARLMSRLPAEEVSACFSRWVQSVARLTEGEVVAIDGKTARRSFDQEDKMGAIHMVSAWASQTGLSLGQVKTQEKSNEITAIPRLLAMLEIKGCIVTIDAMGCQEKIAGKIVEKGADYALAVKGNQKSLHEAIVDYFAVAVDVENSLHWVLDVTFREDESRIRKGESPGNFNIIRQLALNLLKREPSRLSIKRKRFKAVLSDDFRTQVIFG